MTEPPSPPTSPPEPPVSPPVSPPSPPEPPPERTFSQKDVDKIAANRAKEAEEAAYRRLVEETGVGSIDDLKAAYSEYQTIQEATKSDFEKLEEEREAEKARADKAEADREKAREEARLVRIQSKLESELIASGVPAGGVELQDALAVVDNSNIEVNDKGEISGIKEAVQSALEPRPWLTRKDRPVISDSTKRDDSKDERSALQAYREKKYRRNKAKT